MLTGTVKWFDHARGFGFIQPHNGGEDILVHISAVERSGLTSLDRGDTVAFLMEHNRRLDKLEPIDLVITGSGGKPNEERGSRSNQNTARRWSEIPPPREPGGQVGSGGGTVKWFSPKKGFGFIRPDTGGRDVFVHISALHQAGLETLADGQPIFYDLEGDMVSDRTSAINLRLG